MTSPKRSRNDLFYHYVHGLCRLVTVSKPYSKDEETVYTLVPVETSKGMMKFHISESGFESSGFNAMISVREARRLIDFLAGKKVRPHEQSRAWQLAHKVMEINGAVGASETPQVRMDVERSVKSLVFQLGFILNLPIREIAVQVTDALSNSSEINPRLARFLATLGELNANPSL